MSQCKKTCGAFPNCACACGLPGWANPNFALDDQLQTWHFYVYDNSGKISDEGKSLCGKWHFEHGTDHAPFAVLPLGVKACRTCLRLHKETANAD